MFTPENADWASQAELDFLNFRLNRYVQRDVDNIKKYYQEDVSDERRLEIENYLQKFMLLDTEIRRESISQEEKILHDKVKEENGIDLEDAANWFNEIEEI